MTSQTTWLAGEWQLSFSKLPVCSHQLASSDNQVCRNSMLSACSLFRSIESLPVASLQWSKSTKFDYNRQVARMRIFLKLSISFRCHPDAISLTAPSCTGRHWKSPSNHVDIMQWTCIYESFDKPLQSESIVKAFGQCLFVKWTEMTSIQLCALFSWILLFDCVIWSFFFLLFSATFLASWR